MLVSLCFLLTTQLRNKELSALFNGAMNQDPNSQQLYEMERNSFSYSVPIPHRLFKNSSSVYTLPSLCVVHRVSNDIECQAFSWSQDFAPQPPPPPPSNTSPYLAITLLIIKSRIQLLILLLRYSSIIYSRIYLLVVLYAAHCTKRYILFLPRYIVQYISLYCLNSRLIIHIGMHLLFHVLYVVHESSNLYHTVLCIL